jgi:DNA-damage-inducible protein D
VLAAEEELSATSAALTAAQPAIEYHERFVIDSDVVTVKVWGQQFGLTEQQAFQLLRDRKVLYRQNLGERWSASRGCRETVYEYRPYAGRQSFAWFDLRPQHNAPRHHNGQVRQTCYVRQAYALDLAKCAGLVARAAVEVSA